MTGGAIAIRGLLLYRLLLECSGWTYHGTTWMPRWGLLGSMVRINGSYNPYIFIYTSHFYITHINGLGPMVVISLSCKWYIYIYTYILGLFQPLIRSPLIHPLPGQAIQVPNPWPRFFQRVTDIDTPRKVTWNPKVKVPKLPAVLRPQGCHERRVWCFHRRGQDS